MHELFASFRPVAFPLGPHLDLTLSVTKPSPNLCPEQVSRICNKCRISFLRLNGTHSTKPQCVKAIVSCRSLGSGVRVWLSVVHETQSRVRKTVAH